MTVSSLYVFWLSQCAVMQARSALFDLYGDHLRARGGRAPIAALVRLLAPLEIAAPAVRTAVAKATCETLVGFQLTDDQLRYNVTR